MLPSEDQTGLLFCYNMEDFNILWIVLISFQEDQDGGKPNWKKTGPTPLIWMKNGWVSEWMDEKPQDENFYGLKGSGEVTSLKINLGKGAFSETVPFPSCWLKGYPAWTDRDQHRDGGPGNGIVVGVSNSCSIFPPLVVGMDVCAITALFRCTQLSWHWFLLLSGDPFFFFHFGHIMFERMELKFRFFNFSFKLLICDADM